MEKNKEIPELVLHHRHKAETILIEVANLASPEQLPSNLVENGRRIWNAFRLGEAYQRLKHDHATSA